MAQDFEITEKKTQEEGFGQLWSRFSPYWPMLILLFILCGAGAWFYLQYKAPVYEANATILIKDGKKGVDGSKMSEGLNQLSDTKIIDNEIEVINSRSMMSQVVKSLHLYAPVYKAGKWRPYLVYQSSPLVIEVQKPESLHEVKHVDFAYNPTDSSVTLLNKRYSLNEWIETPYGKLKFTPNNIYDTSAEHEENLVSDNKFFFAFKIPR